MTWRDGEITGKMEYDMTWADDEIAGKMGYEYCVLFDCARNAISAYQDVTEKPLGLPENICPELVSHLRERGHKVLFGDVNPLTGLSPGAVHLYGYQAPENPNQTADLSLDPLMTGWVRHLKTTSAVISFGIKKMLPLGYGAAFLTNDQSLIEEIEPKSHWNDDYSDLLREYLPHLKVWRLQCFDMIALWDRYLGDSLIRIPGEQLMPWRVMRRAGDFVERETIVDELRDSGFEVGTNYPPLQGQNEWGDRVLNFFCSPAVEVTEIQDMCEIIKRVVNG